jgi:hypothetical protein
METLRWREIGVYSRCAKRLTWGVMKNAGVVIIAVAVACLGACETEGAGRCQAYVETPGTAHVTAVESAPSTENNCANDPVKVTFDFAPDDETQSARAATGWTVRIAAGMNPPRAALEACGLTVGSSHPAVRSDGQGGPCTPLVIHLADLSGVACQAALGTCF